MSLMYWGGGGGQKTTLHFGVNTNKLTSFKK